MAPEDVGRPAFVPVLLGRLECFDHETGRVVDEAIEAAECVQRLSDRPPAVVDLSDATPDRPEGVGGAVDGAGQVIVIHRLEVDDYDAGALAQELPGSGRADP